VVSRAAVRPLSAYSSGTCGPVSIVAAKCNSG
jgi:hypothetical protein